jgi:catechol 2,3-dioxygenase-like lactoylglutathione lyase family enzyme
LSIIRGRRFNLRGGDWADRKRETISVEQQLMTVKPESHLLHAPYLVNDLERTAKFYREVLGLQEVQRGQSAGDSEHVLLQVPKSGELIKLCCIPARSPVQPQPDLVPLVFEVASLTEFGRHLAKLGLQFSGLPVWNKKGDRFAYLEAPEGYGIELVQRSRVKDEFRLAASESAAPNPPSLGLDYELLQPVGHGAYGEVWLARARPGDLVAVKVVFDESFAADQPFKRALEGLRRFEPISRSYDSQLKILHVGIRPEHGCFYYVMELADDLHSGRQIFPQRYEPRTLKSELRLKGRLPVSECIQVGLALAGALENLHQNGLVHRDVKPANVVFVGGLPKLADIDLVIETDVTIGHVGTEGYIPPEGSGSPQADIFSLGMLLFEISTGWDCSKFPGQPENLDDWPDWQPFLKLNSVLCPAGHADPRRRYKTARALYADLAALRSEV